MPTDGVATSGVAVVLDKEQIDLGHMPGVLPGMADEEEDHDDFLRSSLVKPPVDPKTAMAAVKGDGELAAVCGTVAEGCAGATYKIVPRAEVVQRGFDVNNPETWTPEARHQHDLVQVFVQAGFHGKGAQSLRSGFYEQEHDRVILGWGGVVVFRGPGDEKGMGPSGLPAPPKALGRFHACNAKFTRAAPKPTMVPFPVTLVDGRILWLEEPRHFRRIFYDGGGGRGQWYKQFGDWRAMDSRTGRYSNGSRRLPPTELGMPAAYLPGRLPRGAEPALEVMHWATSFPGIDPYGMSAWHSEMSSVLLSAEAARLVLDHLRSGLFGVILAAANRSFDDASAKAAVAKIDELGRGRAGLGALITLNLMPVDSGSQNVRPSFDADDPSGDRGKLVLHELNTRLPDKVMDGTVRAAAGTKYAHAERVPSILLGKSEAYNFATATAAWKVANRLRFGPHHEDRNTFMSRLLVEMGITFWTVIVKPADWSEEVPIAGVASVVGQNAGMKPNDGIRLLAQATGASFKPFDEWWGEVPMPVLQFIFNSQDPAAMLRLLGFEEEAAAFKPSDADQLIKSVAAKVQEIDATDEAPGLTNG
jgi:capsid portal protein